MSDHKESAEAEGTAGASEGAKKNAPAPEDSLASNVRTITAAVALALIVRIGFFEMFAIDGPSMEPTLLDGDRVVVAKYPYGLFLPFMHEAVATWGGPDVGDVVIVNSPLDGKDIVKRVVGVAGDTLEMRNWIVYRNGEPVATVDSGACDIEEQKRFEEDCHVYTETIDGREFRTSHAQRPMYRDMANWMPVTVPEGHIVVLGDHRDQSNDSRRIGTIPISRVKGRALFIYWSRHPGRDIRWSRFFDAVQ